MSTLVAFPARHVKMAQLSRDLSHIHKRRRNYYDIKNILRLFTIERERSIQHSIHKVLLLTPPPHCAHATSVKIT